MNEIDINLSHSFIDQNLFLISFFLIIALSGTDGVCNVNTFTPTPIGQPRVITLNNTGNTTKISHLNYQNNEDLSWFFQPTSGTLLYRIHFTLSQMEPCRDYLTFGPYGTSPRTSCTGFAGVCSDVYISSSTGIDFRFHSDSSVLYQGFSLGVSVVSNTPIPSAAPSSVAPTTPPTFRPSALNNIGN
jgi:hypothetical protein